MITKLRKDFYIFALILILLCGFALRIYNYNWDNDHYLHPDERYNALTAVNIKMPKDLSEYLDPEKSPFSPYNTDYKAYVYGTLPLFLTKILSVQLDMDVYGNIHEVGRIISSIFDTGTILLVYLITREFLNKRYSLIAALFYALTVLAIQFSHFFTVESFLVFFTALTLKMLLRLLHAQGKKQLLYTLLTGISFGLALASKISAILFGIIIAVVFLILLWRKIDKNDWKTGLFKTAFQGILLLVVTYLVFRFIQPYIFYTNNWLDFTIQPEFLSVFNFLQLAQKGDVIFPPSYQWMNTEPYIFPLKNLFLWGMGLPISIAAVAGLIFHFLQEFRNLPKQISWKNFYHFLSQPLILMLIWIVFVILYVGGNFTKSMRYLVPILPMIAIAAAFFLNLFQKNKKVVIVILLIIFLPSLFWSLAYINIYSQDSTRIAASKWIHQNLPENSYVANESWDDPLPAELSQKDFVNESVIPNKKFVGIMMDVYNADDNQKLKDLYDDISLVDYIFLSSARASGTIGKLPDKFPYMAKYYRLLDSGELGFSLVKEITSYPNLLGIVINDSSAEESFWVYDHPTVWIYKKDKSITETEFQNLF